MVQKWPFFQLSFSGNIGQESIFYDILERKNTFLRYKNKNLQKLKNWHFSKGVNPWFCSINGHFSYFVFSGNISQANVFYDILQRKNPFLCYQEEKLKKSKNWHFFKGVNPRFWWKNGHFANFGFLSQYSPGNYLLRYSRTKKRLFRL